MKKDYSIVVVALLCIVFSNLYSQEKDSIQNLPEIEISAKYVSPVSIAGETMPMRRIPQSVSVINPVRIEDMNITTIDQAMSSVTGVTTIANDNMRSQYKSRGYGMSIMTDGLPAYNSLALSQQFDLSFFEQIEVLRGVSGILQGVPDGQSLGGVINLVKKKTKRDFGISATSSVGSWKNFRNEIDLNMPITKDGKLRTRWVLFLNNRNFFYERSSMNKSGVYGIVDWNATKSTLLSLSYAYQHSRGDVLYNGLPAYRMTSDDNSRNSLPVDRSFNPTPDWDYTEWNTHEIMFSLDQKLSDDWVLRAKSGVKLQTQVNKFGFAGTVTAADTTSNYLRGYNDEYLPRIVSAIDLSGKFMLFKRVQNIFVGANFEDFVDDKKNLSGYYKVQFGNPNLVPDFEIPYDMLNHSKMRVRQGGIYAQLRLSLLDNLNAQVGTRMSSVFASMYDFNNTNWNEVIREECRLTPFAGITYDPIEPMTLYASYSSIFVPQTERREDGSMLDPRTGFQVETGAKSEFLNNHLTCNFALFYLQDNGRAYKTSPAPTYVNGGKVENKGFEVEVNAYPYRGLELSTSYTFLDTKITKSADGNEGLAFSPIEPKHSFKFFAAYRFDMGLSLGCNLISQSTTYASVLTPERCQEPYTLINAFVSYDVNKNIGLYFNCNNITDCVYYSRVGGNGDFFGDPRNFTFSVKCSF
ncbi:MAG: TonB-dependent siderophore receptor [Bacteroidales bacterium]|nr:TonB-dependent siderophore receptor [Bacteroidales bacterium]